MKFRELLDIIDDNETIQLRAIPKIMPAERLKAMQENPKLDIYELDVKKIETHGCAMLFIEIG